jgi:hypothetical protein
MGIVDTAGAWDRTVPTAGTNWQNCECGHGVAVLDRYEGSLAIFRCGVCNAEHSLPTRRNV